MRVRKHTWTAVKKVRDTLTGKRVKLTGRGRNRRAAEKAAVREARAFDGD